MASDVIKRARGRLSRSLAAGLALLAPFVTLADTVYVIDKLLLGVHESRELDSAILKVLPTATALEVLERDGDFAKVRTRDGVTGWVDADYLMSEKPAQILVAELETRRRELEAALEDARKRIESLQANPDSAPALPPVASDALRDLQRLAEENRSLKERLSEAATTPSSHEPAAVRVSPGPADLVAWHWLLLGALLLLAFSLGAYAVDYSVRRRHGGFRI